MLNRCVIIKENYLGCFLHLDEQNADLNFLQLQSMLPQTQDSRQRKEERETETENNEEESYYIYHCTC